MMSDNELWRCADILTARGLTVSFAESATAGRIMADFSLVPDAGKFLKGGLVCYDACLKEDVLEVPASLIEKYSAESAEVTEALAQGLHKLVAADIYIAVTGLTTPGGSEGPDKPVGTMFLAAADRSGMLLFSERNVFSGGPQMILLQTVSWAARLVSQAAVLMIK
jgi:nicotinamide-nucleotide amidase